MASLNAPAAPSGVGVGNPYGVYGQDPGVVAAQQQRDAQKANANALLRQNRSQALINFGDPSLVKGLGFGVDPNTAAAAGANQYSIVHQLHQSDADATRAYLNSLAARGILNSGETGYQAGEESKRYGQALNNAIQQLLSQLGGYTSDWTNATNNADSLVTGALGTAAANPSYYDPNIGGNWTSGLLPNGKRGNPFLLGYGKVSPYVDPGTGGSKIVEYLK